MTNSTPTPHTDSDGTIHWRLNGIRHRVDGPAIEYADGGKEWYLNGKLHRTDGPAAEDANGAKEWCFNGNTHRIDGPAIQEVNGDKEWYINDKPHRTDGPVIEQADGSAEWWVSGERISVPYSHVLTAAFAQGLPIPPEVFPEMIKAIPQATGEQDYQLNQLNRILHQYWPTHVKKILATLFSHPDPTIKHLAFSLLGRQERAENTQDGVRL